MSDATWYIRICPGLYLCHGEVSGVYAQRFRTRGVAVRALHRWRKEVMAGPTVGQVMEASELVWSLI